jgi:hypothetical protein
MRVGIGLTLFYLGALNALLAINLGTCTQGDATRLWGGILTAILYGIACVPLSRTSRPQLAALLLAPAGLVVLGQTGFAFKLLALTADGKPACDLLENITGYPRDGNEASYAAVWMVVAAAGWLTVALVVANFVRRHAAQEQTD